jgi:hypothetical protein
MVDTHAYMIAGLENSVEPSIFEIATASGRVGPGANVFGNRNPYLAMQDEDVRLIPPKILNVPIDYSQRNRVMGCDVGLVHKVLRGPAHSNAGSYVVQGGIGRGQQRGLWYDPSHPLNVPIMSFSNPVASGLNNPLGHPE